MWKKKWKVPHKPITITFCKWIESLKITKVWVRVKNAGRRIFASFLTVIVHVHRSNEFCCFSRLIQNVFRDVNGQNLLHRIAWLSSCRWHVHISHAPHCRQIKRQKSWLQKCNQNFEKDWLSCVLKRESRLELKKTLN